MTLNVRYKLILLGTLGILVTMLGMVIWCVCAWLGSEGEPRRPRLSNPLG